MKPEQFIREFGVEKAREVVEGASEMWFAYDAHDQVYMRCGDIQDGYSIDDYEDCFLLTDLKRLVESLDLFKELKTKKNANREFMKACMRGQTERANQIKRAIEAQDAVFGKKSAAVHESIYGGGQ